MRIGLLTTSFPRHRDDYAGAFVLGNARALAARGHTLDILAPEPDDAMGAPPAHPGMTVHWVPYARPRAWQRTFYGAGAPENLAQRPWLAAGIASYTVALGLAAKARARRWDAVISHWALPCGLVGAAVAGSRPHLAFCHSADVHALTRTELARPLRRFLVQRDTRFWFVSPTHRDAFFADLDANDARVEVSSVGIDLASTRKSRAECRARWDMQRFTVVAVGRLVPVKGLDTLVAALALVPNAELCVAGDGPELDALCQQAKQAGVRLRAVGIVGNEDKTQLLCAADALVVPSHVMDSGRTEGFPTIINEAQALGLPVIATAVGGIPYALHDGIDALLVSPGHPDQLARALMRLQGDPALGARLAAAGRERAEGLTWQALTPTVEALIR